MRMVTGTPWLLTCACPVDSCRIFHKYKKKHLPTNIKGKAIQVVKLKDPKRLGVHAQEDE